MDYLGERLQAIFKEHPDGSLEAIAQLVHGTLSVQQRKDLISSLAVQLDEPEQVSEPNPPCPEPDSQTSEPRSESSEN
jgi:hypothetical protein